MSLTESSALRDAPPSWIEERRRAAFAAFDGAAMPSETEEVWRYVDLGFDVSDYQLAEGGAEALPADAVLGNEIGHAAGTATVIDGATTDVRSDAPDGVVFESVAKAVVSHETMLREVYGKGIPVDLDKLAAAHHAFSTDGVVLYVPPATAVTQPFVIDVQATRPGAVSFPHVTVVVEESSQASVVVNNRSADGTGALVVPQIELYVRDNARLDMSVVQNWDYSSTALAHGRAVVGRDATLRLAEAGLGGELSRFHLMVDLVGRGAHAEILGAYFGEQEQTLDYRYFMNHAAPNTTSEMFLKGAVEDEALSVFTGMIRIEEEAQRTNAHQTNRNLILSDGARAQSVPNLEILANDVRCGHGSTVGPLE
ncbi:MAG: SufD family Fe-S cluster assembly protein, partial [Acidimicrobiia bacterium]|nr:SufD family Fe-S cluster assembly protein [Acidimicrobiia bacterium]